MTSVAVPSIPTSSQLSTTMASPFQLSPTTPTPTPTTNTTASNITANTTNETMVLPELEMAFRLRDTYVWVLLAVGLPGNMACLATVLSMQVTTATFYVALLAVADSLALLLKFVFHRLGTYYMLSSNVVGCNSIVVVNLSSSYANWVLALICFERFFAICFPLKKKVYFTRGRVYISAVVLAACLFVLYLPAFFFFRYDSNNGTCVPEEVLSDFKESVWDEGLYNGPIYFSPFIPVAVFSTLIIVGLQRHRKARQTIAAISHGGWKGGPGCGMGGKDGKAERCFSLMLLCAGLVFLVLTFPACVFQLCLYRLMMSGSMTDKARSFLCYQAVTFLSDANHAVNFFVYFFSTARFRVRFVDLFRRCSRCSRGKSKKISVTPKTTEAVF